MGHTETRVDPLAPAPASMEVFRAPRISLIARPQFLEPEHLPVQWRGDASDGERLAEYAGRLCYMSQHNPINRTTAEYLTYTACSSTEPCPCFLMFSRYSAVVRLIGLCWLM